MRQFARFSEACAKALAWLPGAFLPIVPIRFEQVSAAIGENYGAIVRAEGGRT